MSGYRSKLGGWLGTSIIGVLLSAGACPAEERAAPEPTVTTALHNALTTITEPELLDHVTFLAADACEGREAGTAGGQAAGDYLLEQIAPLELKPGGPDNQYVQPFRNGMRNILAILPGSDPELAQETVVIGAHYDHVGFGGRKPSTPGAVVFNGANDNASGVAGVLEIAEALSQLPQAPRRSVLFAFWDGEEKGLLGSRYYIEHPTVEVDGIVFAIALDMIGRVNKDHFIIWGTGTAMGLREMISRQNIEPKLDLEFRVFNLTLSDHQPFFLKNIPAILPSSGLFRELHRPTDDVELINSDGMRRASQLLCGLILELANRDERLAFAEVSKSEADRNPSRTADPITPRSDDAQFQLGFTCQREPREPSAVIVVQVTADSPAALAGLQTGDRIHGINQVDITQLDPSLNNLDDSTTPSTLSIERNGVFLTLTLDSQADRSHAPSP